MYSWSVRCGAWLKGLVRSRAVMLTAAVLGLNVPFLLCHPAWTPIELPALRALAVALVLLVLPGWPLVAAMVRRGWLAPECWVARIAASMGIFAILIIVLHVAGIEPRAALVWNATWIVANLGIVVFVIASRSKPGIANIAPSQPASWLTLVVFAAAFLVYAHAATSIVPKMDDHDFETQGTAYSLVHDLVPKLLTDRHTTYYFAHPPLLHACVAGSFLYWNELDDLKPYETAWKRNQAAAEGRLTETPLTEFWRLPDGPTPAELGTISSAAPEGKLATSASHRGHRRERLPRRTAVARLRRKDSRERHGSPTARGPL